MALITTFVTTPLTSALYPSWYQRKLTAWKRGEIDWESGKPVRDGHGSFDDEPSRQKLSAARIGSLLIYLRLDNMPNTLALVSLFGGRPGESDQQVHPLHNEKGPGRESAPLQEKRRPIVQIHGMHIAQLTARTTSVMKVSEADELSAFDPVLNAFRVLGRLYNLAVTEEVVVVPEDSYAESLVTRASEESSDLLLLPWTETGSLSEAPMVSKNTIERKLRSDAYSSFVAEALNTSQCATAVFINKGFSGILEQSSSALSRRIAAKSGVSTPSAMELPTADRSHHTSMPFFGGADGQAAIRLVLQLAKNPEITAPLIHYQIKSEDTISQEEGIALQNLPEGKIRVSTSCDGTDDDAFFVTMQRTLPDILRSRVTFRTNVSYDPVQDAVANAFSEVGQNRGNGGDLIVLRRHTAMAESQASSCLGLVADVMLEREVRGSLVVMQGRKEVVGQFTMRREYYDGAWTEWPPELFLLFHMGIGHVLLFISILVALLCILYLTRQAKPLYNGALLA